LYGPVSFEISAVLIRLFGLSLAAWRLVCFFGVILTIAVSTALVRRAGGDAWGQLLTILLLSLIGSIATSQPGRFDFVSSGMFMTALFLLAPVFRSGSQGLLWRTPLAGTCVGVALGSTPRILTLVLASVIGVLAVVAVSRQIGRKILLTVFSAGVVALLIHSALLLPWGHNTFSWYAFVRHAAAQDAINASPLTGRGAWGFDLRLLHYNKFFAAIWVLIVLLGALGVLSRSKRESSDEYLPIRLFLTVIAFANFALMLILLAHSVSQVAFWLPLTVTASMSWFEWECLRATQWRKLSIALMSACVVLSSIRETQETGSLLLSWRPQTTENLTGFLKQTLPLGAVVLGPVGGYFYPVTLAGFTYLYPYEQTTPGLYSGPNAISEETIDEEICAHKTFILWPEPDPVHQPVWSPIPAELQDRLLPPLGELRWPPIVGWRDLFLRHIGNVGGKYGSADVRIWPLRSQKGCGTSRFR
jgi:hypothetical protein